MCRMWGVTVEARGKVLYKEHKETSDSKGLPLKVAQFAVGTR